VTANAGTALIKHYVDNSRALPWRSPPGAPPPDPYRVWLSEVMLQQTTVAAVAPRFERFVERWPTIEALAAANEADVLSEWAGLGYYARARNLIACARAVAERGAFPAARSELLQLPGIGDYTSAAIAAIAFGERAAAVDTNVERVIARLYALERPGRTEVEGHVLAMLPEGSAGDFAQALMDLGATICRPRAPRCGECPLRAHCAAFAGGRPEAFPARRPKRIRPHKRGTAWWTEMDGRVWLVRRDPKGMLGGMAALAGSDWNEQARPAPNALGTVHHLFTHFILDLDVVAAPEPAGEGWWHPLDRLAEAGLPTLYRRAAELALAATREARAAA
jgi:A/G-specific adenine glycosylase